MNREALAITTRSASLNSGEAYLLADEVDKADACAERAVTLARGRGERGYEAWALRLMGEVVSHRARADVATAAARYDVATTLASQLEMRHLLAHCQLGLSALYGKAGNPAEAEKHLITATVMYREMGMSQS